MDSEYLIERDICKAIDNHLSKKEITIISGTRQCGKSTILHKLRTNLKKEDKKILNYSFRNLIKLLKMNLFIYFNTLFLSIILILI